MNISERLANIMLKEETYTLTVPRTVSQKIAPALTSIKNVTVTKSFDLKDLENHRFMINSKMDAHTIENELKNNLRREPQIQKTIALKMATPNSMEEAIEESIVEY